MKKILDNPIGRTLIMLLGIVLAIAVWKLDAVIQNPLYAPFVSGLVPVMLVTQVIALIVNLGEIVQKYLLKASK